MAGARILAHLARPWAFNSSARLVVRLTLGKKTRHLTSLAAHTAHGRVFAQQARASLGSRKVSDAFREATNRRLGLRWILVAAARQGELGFHPIDLALRS